MTSTVAGPATAGRPIETPQPNFFNRKWAVGASAVVGVAIGAIFSPLDACQRDDVRQSTISIGLLAGTFALGVGVGALLFKRVFSKPPVAATPPEQAANGRAPSRGTEGAPAGREAKEEKESDRKTVTQEVKAPPESEEGLLAPHLFGEDVDLFARISYALDMIAQDYHPLSWWCDRLCCRRMTETVELNGYLTEFEAAINRLKEIHGLAETQITKSKERRSRLQGALRTEKKRFERIEALIFLADRMIKHLSQSKVIKYPRDIRDLQKILNLFKQESFNTNLIQFKEWEDTQKETAQKFEEVQRRLADIKGASAANQTTPVLPEFEPLLGSSYGTKAGPDYTVSFPRRAGARKRAASQEPTHDRLVNADLELPENIAPKAMREFLVNMTGFQPRRGNKLPVICDDYKNILKRIFNLNRDLFGRRSELLQGYSMFVKELEDHFSL